MLSQADFTDHATVATLLWRLLREAAGDRRSPWHVPVVATVGLDGAPEARVMVLRAADEAGRTLRLHSDSRSAKVRELAANPAVSLLCYDAPLRLQLRLRGRAWYEAASPVADAAWSATRPFSRRCYMAPDAPGAETPLPASGLPTGLDEREPGLAESEAGRGAFGVMLVAVDSLEWLFLAHAGHRRGRLDWDGGHWRGRWLLP
ncbi:pyridoxamine 5'-phosphate oxidase family protein [Sandaracinobacteroides saxicola]|uniref:Pyridoxamine 5'-phosphate oxidase family protein n=2 Tax=Sandaracinobacteroides saxicola TaxID=2759707 RepID=A0A7G5IMW9_9SPHN|nr:pyridoxamine 5'-phosphate oxidase family protein [Sandaracinobacteroides saxicola]